jgi:N-acetylglucosaminyl-diphospho-decaprenol L-rhamnosyltransferase
MKLYTIIVTYNAEQWIEKCLSSLSQVDVANTIVVVDNASKDTTKSIVSKFPAVVLLPQTDNLGFGKANNIGIEEALKQGADFVFLLNQDAYLHAGSVKNVLQQMNANSKLALVSPVHLAGDATNLDFAFYSYVKPSNTNYLADAAQNRLKSLYTINFVNAAAWLIKAEVIKQIGGFHPIFEHYGEDEEYCIRLKNNGYNLAVSSELFILHDRPQHRTTNAYFLPHKQLRRTLIIEYFANKNKRSADDAKRFFKLIVWLFLTLKWGRAFLAIKEFTKYKKDLGRLSQQA